jgi:hypothetical protein
MFSRAFAQPSNPNSLAQQSVRSNLTLASQAYSLTDDAEADAWLALSDALPRVDKNGNPYTIGAKGAYVQVNSLRLLDGQSISDTAPSAVTQAAPTDITDVDFVDASPDTLSVIFEHGNDDGFFLLELTRPLPGLRRQPRDSDFVLPTTDLADSIVAQASSPQTIAMNIPDMRFVLAADDRIGVRITAISPGYVRGQTVERIIVVNDAT